MLKTLKALESFASADLSGPFYKVVDCAIDLKQCSFDGSKLGSRVEAVRIKTMFEELQVEIEETLGEQFRSLEQCKKWHAESKEKFLREKVSIAGTSLAKSVAKLQKASRAIIEQIDAFKLRTTKLDPHKQKALELWNPGGKSWSQIDKLVNKITTDGKSLSQSIHRYANATDQYIRIDKSKRSIADR